MRKLCLALGALSFVLPATAQAHFNLTMPPSMAKSTEGGKGNAPCGPDTAALAPNPTITPVTGGQTLMLNIDETTPHPGFYRFAISMTSPPTFPADNVVKDKSGMVLTPTSQGVSDTAAFEDPAKFPVIADHMFVHGDVGKQSFPSATYPGQVTVPNINCDKCTLQVIEFMSNHGTNGPSAGFFYHHCALLKITADPGKPIFDPNAAGGAGGAGSGGASGAAGASGTAGASGAAATSGGGGGGGGTGGSAGLSGGGTSAAGAPAAAGASTGGAAPSAGAAGAPVISGGDPGDDGGGCSLGHRTSRNTAPALALLAGLLALGRRRRARG